MTRIFDTLSLLRFVTLLQVAKCYVSFSPIHTARAPSAGKRVEYSNVGPTQYIQKAVVSPRIHPNRLAMLHATTPSPDDILYLQTLVHSFHDFISTTTQSTVHTASTLLADAATETAPTEQSWWDTYLNFIASSISFVHSVIDQPLRNTGFDQTWGVSIFLFTAGMFLLSTILVFEYNNSIFGILLILYTLPPN
jgi:hypothetical protein